MNICPWCGHWSSDGCGCAEECICGSPYGDCSPDGEACPEAIEWERSTRRLIAVIARELCEESEATAMLTEMAVGG